MPAFRKRTVPLPFPEISLRCFVLAALAFAPACGSDSRDRSGGSSEDSGGSSTTVVDDGSSGATTDGPAGSTSTDGGPTSTVGGESNDMGSTGEESGGSIDYDPHACLDWCAELAVCEAAGASCEYNCTSLVEQAQTVGPACGESYASWMECRMTETCASGVPDCARELAARNPACLAEVSSICSDECAHRMRCDLRNDADACALSCAFEDAAAENGSTDSAACADAIAAMRQCWIDSSCAELSDGTVCENEVDAAYTSCE